MIWIGFLAGFFPFMFASIMVNFYKWKYYKKVYDDLPNKKFILWESADGNSLSSDEPYEERFYRYRGGSYKLLERIYLNRDFMNYFDPYSLYYLSLLWMLVILANLSKTMDNFTRTSS
jgi:hypothetical protein